MLVREWAQQSADQWRDEQLFKIIPPNGCLYCNSERRSHGQRFDSLHPSGANGYTEPTNKVRLARMKRNRQLRSNNLNPTNMYGEFVANLSASQSMVGQWVTYHGSNYSLKNRKFKVVAENDRSLQVDFSDVPGFDVEWRSRSAFKLAEAPRSVPNDGDRMFLAGMDLMNPHASTISVLDNEIDRLQKRIDELKAAKTVLTSL